MMKSIKEYANEKGVSYEAVRKQVIRYSDKLSRHIVKTGNLQMLDEEAQRFLDEKRNSNPLVQRNEQRDAEYENTKAAKEALMAKIFELQEELKKSTESRLLLETEKTSIREEEFKKREELIEKYTKKEEEHFEALSKRNEEIATLKAQLQSANEKLTGREEELTVAKETIHQKEEELIKQRNRSFFQRLFNK